MASVESVRPSVTSTLSQYQNIENSVLPSEGSAKRDAMVVLG